VLGGVVEVQVAVAHLDVALLHGRQPVGLVGDRVVLGADAEEAAVQQPDGHGEDVVLGEVLAREVALDALAQPRQRAGEDDHVLELGLVAPGAPARVVEVLLAVALVDARGLDVAAGVRADPDVLPGGRDDQLGDAGQDLGIVDARTIAVEDREAAAAPDAAQAGTAAVDLAEARGGHVPIGVPGLPARTRAGWR
jgi:hypothetical protein